MRSTRRSMDPMRSGAPTRHWPDLVVLDLMLPGIDGLEVCRQLRARAQIPVIMLTARGDEDDRIVGLERGADDYVTKPFSPRELVARVAAVLRRAHADVHEQEEPIVLVAGDLRADTAARELTKNGNPVVLTAREFDLLTYLMRNPARLLPRRAARTGLGIHLRRHLNCDGPHSPPAREDRDGPGTTHARDHGVGRRLSVRRMTVLAMSQSHAVQLVAVATISAAVAGLIGALAAWLLRRRSIAVQVLVVALDAVLAVAIGVRFAVGAMLVAPEDLQAVDVALVAAGAVAVVAAWLLGRRVGRSSAMLVAAAARVGDGEPDLANPTPAPSGTAPLELTRLAAQLKETSTRLDEARERERALDASRRELVAWVSHDLRTPLAGMRAIVEALEDGVVDDPETVQRYHRTLREEVDHLAALVDDLFELSRTQAGALHLELARVSLGDVVSDALSGARPIAAAKGVHLVGELVGPPPELDRVGARTAARVAQPARERDPAHARGRYRRRRGGSRRRRRLRVRAGLGRRRPGIRSSPHLRRRVPRRSCTPGQRCGARAGDRGQFVEAHRGEIRVRNENGGARFTVSLPLDPVGPR